VDVVVLDIMLPDVDGFEVCRRISPGVGMYPFSCLRLRRR